MQKLLITEPLLRRFAKHLRDEERSPATMDKYIREAKRFADYAGRRAVDRAMTLAYKADLGGRYPAKSANSMLASVNSLFRFAGRDDLCVRQFRLQKEIYRPEERELTREEYLRLITEAERRRDPRGALIFQTICCTGIRISELGYITVEAAKAV